MAEENRSLFAAQGWGKEEPAKEITLSTLDASNTITVPTSKGFWRQPAIAKEGMRGMDITVDKHGTYITAKIHDGKNNPLKVDEVQMAIQAALGSLIIANGKPLVLSITQIVREALKLSPDENPSPEQLKTYEKALDTMLTASAQIDYQRQLDAHKKLKRKPDEDYKNLFGTLISGVKLTEKVTHNGVEVTNTSYQIYDMPMFVRYSYLIGQIAAVNKTTLSSREGAKTLPKGHPDKKKVERTAANEIVKSYIVSLLHAEGMKKGGTIKVAFATIADRCGIDVSSRQRMRTFRSNVNAIMRDFKAEKVISGFNEYTKGKRTEGIEIRV